MNLKKKILHTRKVKMTKILTLREIRKMAVGKNIKNMYKLSKEELAKELNIDEELYKRPSNAREVLITNVDTQVVTKCKSIYQCSKLLSKSYSLTHYYATCGNAFVDKDGNKVKLSIT